MRLQDQQKAQGKQQLLVGIFLEQNEQQKQQEKIAGIHIFQMEPIQQPTYCPGKVIAAVRRHLRRKPLWRDPVCFLGFCFG